MKIFRDDVNAEWTLELLRPQFRRVQAELQIDLLDIGNQQLWPRLIDDPALLVDLAWVLLREQAESREIDELEFARRLRGDALDRFADLLLEELIDFFPSRRRQMLRAALAKTRTLMARHQEHARTILDSPRLEQLVDLQLERMGLEIDQEIDRLTTGGPFTAGPATAAPTPTGRPCEPSPG